MEMIETLELINSVCSRFTEFGRNSVCDSLLSQDYVDVERNFVFEHCYPHLMTK